MPRKLLGLACGAFLLVGLCWAGPRLKRRAEPSQTPPIPRLTQAQTPAFTHHPPVVCSNCPPAPPQVVSFHYPAGATTKTVQAWDVKNQKFVSAVVPVRWEVQSKLWDGVWSVYTNFTYDGSNLTVNTDSPARLFRVVLYP